MIKYYYNKDYLITFNDYDYHAEVEAEVNEDFSKGFNSMYVSFGNPYDDVFEVKKLKCFFWYEDYDENENEVVVTVTDKELIQKLTDIVEEEIYSYPDNFRVA